MCKALVMSTLGEVSSSCLKQRSNSISIIPAVADHHHLWGLVGEDIVNSPNHLLQERERQ